MFKYITTIAMIILWGGMSWISINVLVSFLSSSGLVIYCLGFGLELGKLLLIIYVHKSWKNSGLFKKFSYSICISIVMMLTVCEVVGFLSEGYILSTQDLRVTETELQTIAKEKQFLEKQISLIEINILDFPKGYGTKRGEAREKSNLDSKINRMSELFERERELSLKKINGVDSGPVFATTKLFNINPEKTASSFIKILVCVLELMSTYLAITVSALWQKEKEVAENCHSENYHKPELINSEESLNINSQSDRIETVNRLKIIPISETGNGKESSDSEWYQVFISIITRFKLSPEQLAKITGKAKAKTVEAWLSGETEIPLKELYKITSHVENLKQDIKTA